VLGNGCAPFLTLSGIAVSQGLMITFMGSLWPTLYGTRWIAFAAAGGLILGAIYILYMVGKVVIGPLREPADAHDVRDLEWHEIGALAPLAVACLVLGLYPSPVLRSIEAPIATTLRPTKIVQIERKAEMRKKRKATAAVADTTPVVAEHLTLTEVSR